MKRGFGVFFVILLIILFNTLKVSASPADLNSDNKVNATDIQLIIRWILGIDQTNPATDMDGNGQVNIFDLVNASRLFGKIYGADSLAPTIISSSPSANLSSGVTSAILFAKTDERATCKYLNSSSGNYSVNMTTFTRTGGVSHSTTLAGLANGTLYNYYVQCQDEAGNLNSTNYNISFGVNAGGGSALLFASDWGTALGTSDAALRDTSKTFPWNYTVVGASPIIEVVTAASVTLFNGGNTLTEQGWPTANALRSNYTGGSGIVDYGHYDEAQNNSGSPVPEIQVGEYFYMRWYWANDGNDALGGSTWGSPHSPQMGPAGTCPGTWAYNFGNLGGDGLNSVADGTYKVTLAGSYLWFDLGGYDNSRRSAANYTGGNVSLVKGAVYRFEIQIYRAGTNVINYHARVYDRNGTLLYGDNDFIERFYNGVLSDNPPPTVNYTATMDQINCLAGMMFGVGGNSGIPVGMKTYSGAVAVKTSNNANDWIGPYVPGEAP